MVHWKSIVHCCEPNTFSFNLLLMMPTSIQNRYYTLAAAMYDCPLNLPMDDLTVPYRFNNYGLFNPSVTTSVRVTFTFYYHSCN
jgi:hypothetical protein